MFTSHRAHMLYESYLRREAQGQAYISRYPYDHSSLDHHAMTYDHQRQRTVLFGDKLYQGESPVALGYFRCWDGTTWLPVA